MDEYVKNKSVVCCKRRKRNVELTPSIGIEKKTYRNTFLENGEKQRSKLRLAGPMSTIVEENLSPQIRELNQNVKELLIDINNQISCCDSNCNTSVGASTSGSSQTDSNMSTTTTSDPSATSHDVESLTFCSSRKSRSFHFTTSKNSSGDVFDYEIPKLARHQRRRMRRHSTMVANVLAKKSLSNSDIYNQQYAVFPVHVEIPNMLRRNKVVKNTSSSSIAKRKRDALIKFRQPSILSTILRSNVDGNIIEKQIEAEELNINPKNSEHNCEIGQLTERADKKEKRKHHKKDKEAKRNKSPEAKKDSKRFYDDEDCNKRNDLEVKSKYKIKKVSSNSSIEDFEVRDEKNKKHHKRNEKHELQRKTSEMKISDDNHVNHKSRSLHNDQEKFKEEITRTLKTHKLSPTRVISPVKHKAGDEVLCDKHKCHKDQHKHKDRGDSATKYVECKEPIHTVTLKVETGKSKQLLDVDDPKGKGKRKKQKGKEKHFVEVDFECGEPKKSKRESSLVRIKHSLMQLAGFTKLGDRKRSRSKKRNKTTEKFPTQLNSRESSPVRLSDYVPPPLFDVYTVNVKVKKSCNMQRFFEQNDADMENLCSCEYIAYDKKPRPTITRAQLGSLEIPPFKPKRRKRESRHRHRKHHKTKEANKKGHKHVDIGTMPQCDIQHVNKKVQDTESKYDSSFRSTGCLVGDFEKPSSRCSLLAQPTFGSIISSYDSHETVRAWDTSLTSLGEVSNLMIISELGSNDDKSGSFVSNKDVSKAIHHIVEHQSNKNDNNLKSLVESLYVRPIFDRYPGCLMEPYCYMTLNTSLNKRKIKNKSTNTDIVWTKDDLKIEYYSRAINKAKTQLPLISKSRRSIFKRSYSNRLLTVKRSRRFYQANNNNNQSENHVPPPIEVEIQAENSQTKHLDVLSPGSKIPVFFSGKRFLFPPTKKTDLNSSDASSFVDSGKSETKKATSRIPRPRTTGSANSRERSVDSGSPKDAPSKIFDRDKNQGDAVVPPVLQDLSFDLESPLLDALTQSKDIANLDEEMIDFVFSDTDSKSDNKFQSKQSSAPPDTKQGFGNIFAKPCEIAAISTIAEEHGIVELKAAEESFDDDSKHSNNMCIKETSSLNKSLPKVAKKLTKAEKKNDVKKTTSRILDQKGEAARAESLKNFLESTKSKKRLINEVDKKLTHQDDLPPKDSLPNCKSCQLRNGELNVDLKQTNAGDNVLIKLERKKKIESNTTYIVNLTELDEQHNSLEDISTSLIEDELKAMHTEEVKTGGAHISKHSVCLQVLMPMKHANTNTSRSYLANYSPPKKSNWKSRLPLPIHVVRNKLPVRNSYTFPIEIDLNRLNQLNQSDVTSENTGRESQDVNTQDGQTQDPLKLQITLIVLDKT